jgi:transcriptional regulator with XRE-family HTH domain
MSDDWSGLNLPDVPDDLNNLDWTRLADYLRRRRERLGFTQAELAQSAGVSVATIQNFERGRVPKTAPTRLTTVVMALGWVRGSGIDIARGLEPTLLKEDADGQRTMLFIMSNLPKAGPWTLRAIRAVLESDIAAHEGDDDEE